MVFDRPVIYGTSYKGKLYIGQHSGNKKNYVGSGKIINCIKKNKEKKKYLITGVIEYVNNLSLLDKKEKYWIKKLKPQLNLSEGGRNNITEDMLKNLSKNNKGKNNPMFNKTHSEELKKRYSLERLGENNPFYNKKHNKTFIEGLKNTIHIKKNCIYCNFLTNLGNLKKYHNENCDKKGILV